MAHLFWALTWLNSTVSFLDPDSISPTSARLSLPGLRCCSKWPLKVSRLELLTWILQLSVKSTTPHPAPITQRPRNHDVIHPQVSAQLFPACPWPYMSLDQPYSTSMLQIKNNPSGKHSLVPKSRLGSPFLYSFCILYCIPIICSTPLFFSKESMVPKRQLLSFLCTRVLRQLEGKSKSFVPLYISGA